MKKIIVFYVAILLIAFIITYQSYISYSSLVNGFVSQVIDTIKEDNPLFDESKIIKIINESDYDSKTLNDYGLSSNDISVLKSFQNNFKKSLGINLFFVSLGFIILGLFIYYFKRKEKKELARIINYIRNLNDGNYDLIINDNKEGIYSLLKNEIYTTTVMLREQKEQALKDKKDLKESLENISHQLKTPLTSITLLVENLDNPNMSNKMRSEFIKDIKLQIDNINNLIINMLKLSRLDANVVVFKKENINVKKLVFEVLKYLDAIRELKNIDICVTGVNNVSFVGDYKWEFEALSNLVKNCIEYSAENKKITISFSENSCYTKIVIQDEGLGINENEKNKIFERFYRGKNSLENNFGIGLSLAKEIINKDSGNLIIESVLNKGTKFIIKYYK